MNAYGVQIRFQATDLQRITATVSAKVIPALLPCNNVAT